MAALLLELLAHELALERREVVDEELAGEPCHIWVDAVEQRTEFTDLEWSALPGPPTPQPARGTPFREVVVNADRVLVGGDEIEPPWSELALRLEEAAVTRVLEAIEHQGHNCNYDKLDEFWVYANPLAASAAPEADQ